MLYRLVGAFLWCCEAAYDTKEWLVKQWRKHVIDDCPPHLDTCESCREVSCDCTKVATCNRIHGLATMDTTTNRQPIKLGPTKTKAVYVQMVGRGPAVFTKDGLPMGRKVGRPTRRT